MELFQFTRFCCCSLLGRQRPTQHSSCMGNNMFVWFRMLLFQPRSSHRSWVSFLAKHMTSYNHLKGRWDGLGECWNISKLLSFLWKGTWVFWNSTREGRAIGLQGHPLFFQSLGALRWCMGLLDVLLSQPPGQSLLQGDPLMLGSERLRADTTLFCSASHNTWQKGKRRASWLSTRPPKC